MRATPSLILAALLLVPTLPLASDQPMAVLRPVVEEAQWPVQVAFAPDGRMFFNERLLGRVRVVEDGVLRAEPFLDLRTRVSLETGSERGLLGLAVDPDFGREPWVYVFYAYRDAEGIAWNRVERFAEANGVAGTSQILLDRIPSASVHNGGVLAFGVDGTLFVTTGDAAEPSLAQDPESLAGKVLRIWRDGTVPSDNPLAGSPVFTLGHRNVFGLAVHPTTGVPYVSENAPAEPEEVNRLLPGRNYGWPEVLGVANDPRYTDPLVELPRMAPTGLAFYTGGVFAAWRGDLFLGSYLRGQLLRFRLGGEAGNRIVSEEVVVDVGDPVLDVEDGLDGYLYVTTPAAVLRLEANGVPPPSADGALVAVAAAVGGGIVLLLLTALLRHRAKRK